MKLSHEDHNRLVIKKPSISEVERYRPYRLKYFPILKFDDLTDKDCFYTPYFNLVKGCHTYIGNRDWFNFPNSTSPNNLYSYYMRLYRDSIINLIEKIRYSITDLEPNFDRSLWISRCNTIVSQTHERIIPQVLDGFTQFLSLYDTNVHNVKRSFQYLNPFIFNPDIPVPISNSNMPYRVSRPPQTRLIELNMANPTSNLTMVYYMDLNSKFPGIGEIALIDFTNKLIIDFLYYDPSWISGYDPNKDNLYNQGYVFETLFNLWLWRYAASTLSDSRGNGFQTQYFLENIFPFNVDQSNQKIFLPNINNMGDISEFSIKVITPNHIYDEDEFNNWGLNPEQILAEKIISTHISLSTQPYKVKSIRVECPYSEMNYNEFPCSHRRDSKCFVHDITMIPPLLHEINIGNFQKLLRNEYFRYSKYYYILYHTFQQNNLDIFRQHFELYIGTLMNNGNSYQYVDHSNTLFNGVPPSNPEKIILTPISPYIYSENWILKDPFTSTMEINPIYNDIVKDMFYCHGNPDGIQIMLIEAINDEFLFLIKNQQSSLWEIIKHQNTDRDQNQIPPDQIIQRQLANNSKRAGTAFFGNNIFYNE